VPKTDWKIEIFPYGKIWAERIDFSIDGHDFLMVFTPVSEINDQETLAQKSEDVGFIIPDNSYDVKFDRIENFESGDFYASPSSGMDLSQLNRLGIGITQIMEFHYSMKNTEVYFATAENYRLSRRHAVCIFPIIIPPKTSYGIALSTMSPGKVSGINSSFRKNRT
jgi:hypothetical protein